MKYDIRLSLTFREQILLLTALEYQRKNNPLGEQAEYADLCRRVLKDVETQANDEVTA